MAPRNLARSCILMQKLENRLSPKSFTPFRSLALHIEEKGCGPLFPIIEPPDVPIDDIEPFTLPSVIAKQEEPVEEDLDVVALAATLPPPIGAGVVFLPVLLKVASVTPDRITPGTTENFVFRGEGLDDDVGVLSDPVRMLVTNFLEHDSGVAVVTITAPADAEPGPVPLRFVNRRTGQEVVFEDLEVIRRIPR